ncbi:MAG: DUF3024 domain-containing protein [Acidimicrobiia bacterium]|nr:DUF3024 domain-containing protein [Acidimicrobiia bacterium]MDX2467165.1 DUF3024 domain-containing protein [Acidimicrobiia bacterium]
MVPEIDVERVRRWAAVRVPVKVQDELRLAVDVDRLSITVMECRAPWTDSMTDWTRRPVARFRYTQVRGEWTLYCYRSSGDFERFVFADPTPKIEDLLDVVDDDPTCIFWG